MNTRLFCFILLAYRAELTTALQVERSPIQRSRLSEVSSSRLSSAPSSSLFWPTSVQEENIESSEDKEAEGSEFYQQIFDSIIKIHATHSEPDFIMPWQTKHPSSSTSSGFIIKGNRIMTNAHSVEYATMVQVQRRGDPTKYQATLETIANECDLAILRVTDEGFWDNLSVPLEFGSLPQLQDEVEVLGYPEGRQKSSDTSHKSLSPLL